MNCTKIRTINIICDLQNLMKDDFNDSSTRKVRHALNNLGIKTKIPHNEIKKAILHCQLRPIEFLLKIKEYLSDNRNKVVKKTKVLKYTLEERLIVSGIVHLGLPDLFTKLNYCLSDPVPEKKLKYIHLKNPSPKEYLSPYLQPSYLNRKFWYENEKIKLHNNNVKIQNKRQKLRKSILNIRKLHQGNKCHNKEEKMKRNNPKHSLNALFIKLPLNNVFENQYNEEIDNVKEKKSQNKRFNGKEFEKKYISSQVLNTDINIVPIFLKINEISNKIVSKTENNINLSKNSLNVQNIKFEQSKSVDFSTKLPSVTSNFTNLSDYNTHEWQNLNITRGTRLKSSLSFHYEYESISEESEPEETIEDEDFSFLRDDIRDTEDNAYLNKASEQDPFEKDVKIIEYPYNVKMYNKRLSQIIENSSMINLMNNQSKIEDTMIRMFNNQINVFPEYRLHSLGIAKAPQNVKNMIVDSIKRTDEEKIVNRSANVNLEETIQIDFDRENRSLLKAQINDKVSNQSKTEQSVVNGEIVNHIQMSHEQKTHIFDEILTVLRKLPQRKQLKEVLKLLAILGDPVASLPKLTELDILNRWYEIRLNVNRYLTSQKKAELLRDSVYFWQLPRPKVKDIPIPQNPCTHLRNNTKWTWNKKETALKKINQTKNNYIYKVKELMLNNTKNLYPSFKTLHYKSRLNKDLKKTYHCYFPTKEDDIVFANMSTKNENLKNDKKGSTKII